MKKLSIMLIALCSFSTVSLADVNAARSSTFTDKFYLGDSSCSLENDQGVLVDAIVEADQDNQGVSMPVDKLKRMANAYWKIVNESDDTLTMSIALTCDAVTSVDID